MNDSEQAIEKYGYPFTHAYCRNCETIKPCRIDSNYGADVSGKYKGGDICCSECCFILATVFVEIYPVKSPVKCLDCGEMIAHELAPLHDCKQPPHQ